jgi:CHAD domain-containing protein
MSYQFAPGEAEELALQRCAGEQLDSAIAELSEGITRDPATAVHSARKALKKERSLLRLARGAIGASERRRMNAALRDAGRRLSSARDAEVMIQAVDGLSEHYAGQLPKRTFTTLKTRLNRQAAGSRTELAGGLSAEVLETLRGLRLEVDQWRLRRTGWRAISDGLGRSYARGRRAYRRAARKPTVENLHEFRKRGKDLWYHLRLLEPLSTGILQGYAEEAHRLSDLLGDDHDLAVLHDALRAEGVQAAADTDSVIALIDHRRHELQTEALLVGARLFAEQTGAFVERLHRYWKTSQAGLRAAEQQPPLELPGRRSRRPAATPAA